MGVENMWLVHVQFFDHVVTHTEHKTLMRCDAFGLLLEDTETYIRLVTWVTDGKPESDDSEGFIIAKGPGFKLSRLKQLPNYFGAD